MTKKEIIQDYLAHIKGCLTYILLYAKSQSKELSTYLGAGIIISLFIQQLWVTFILAVYLIVTPDINFVDDIIISDRDTDKNK
jgi:hypothetical protein